MAFRARLARLGVLAVLLALLGLHPLTAAASVDPEPDDIPPAMLTTDCLAIGAVQIFPDQRFCWCVWQVPSRIRFLADVNPNRGAPKAKITIWSWDTSGNNETLVFSAKRTGAGAVDVTFTVPGFYQMCAKYPLGQLVDGTGFDYMVVTSNVI